MSNQRSKDIDKALEMVRMLVAAVRDDSLEEEEADQLVGKLLVGLDQIMARIDGTDTAMTPPHLVNKIEIEPPKSKSKSRAKKDKTQ